uniref:Uncharacterized protein n=1 Tax=uncultured marine virus TaxID=186617 RepID=A0A0F7L3X7_9VIRU|nr:hypothetical protein [uncultured marine virus]
MPSEKFRTIMSCGKNIFPIFPAYFDTVSSFIISCKLVSVQYQYCKTRISRPYFCAAQHVI